MLSLHISFSILNLLSAAINSLLNTTGIGRGKVRNAHSFLGKLAIYYWNNTALSSPLLIAEAFLVCLKHGADGNKCFTYSIKAVHQ